RKSMPRRCRPTESHQKRLIQRNRPSPLFLFQKPSALLRRMLKNIVSHPPSPPIAWQSFSRSLRSRSLRPSVKARLGALGWAGETVGFLNILKKMKGGFRYATSCVKSESIKIRRQRDLYLVAFHTDRTAGDGDVRIAVPLAGADVELPSVPWTGHDLT